MGIFAGIGFSQNLDPRKAALEAAQQATAQLNRDRIDFALVFNSVSYAPKDFLPVLYEQLKQTKILGCSSPGLMINDRVDSTGLGVMVFYSESVKFETCALPHLHLQNMSLAGQHLAKTLLNDYSRAQNKVLLFFADSLLDNLGGLSESLNSHLGEDVPLIGGGSSDDFHFLHNDLYQNQNLVPRGAAAVMMGGDFLFGFGCQHGWRPLGKPRRITASQGSIIQSIDGKKAVEIYREFFGDEADDLRKHQLGLLNVRYPLGLHNGGRNEFLLRHIIEALDDGSLRCQDTIPPSETVHMMIGSKESCLQSAEAAALQVKTALQGRTPKAILVMESLMRYRILGRAAEQEAALIQNILGPVPLLGVYTYGQFYNVRSQHTSSKPFLQNGSIILLAIG